MRRTNKTEFAILGFLSLEPMSGYDMKVAISRTIDFFWAASYGQLYPTLKSLHRDGCISRSVDARDSARTRHVYRLTEKGRKKLAAWLQAEIEPEPVRNELLLKLFFGNAVDWSYHRTHLHRYLEEQQAKLKIFGQIQKGVLTSQEQDPSHALWLSTLRYGIHIARARIRWCRETLAALESK